MALNLMSLNSCFIIAMTGIFIFWLGIGADRAVGLLPDRHYQRGVWHRHLAGAGALPGAVNGFCVMRLKIHPMVDVSKRQGYNPAAKSAGRQPRRGGLPGYLRDALPCGGAVLQERQNALCFLCLLSHR